MQRASEFIYKRRLKSLKSHCRDGTKPLIDTMTLGSSFPLFLLPGTLGSRRFVSVLAGLFRFSSDTGFSQP